MIDFVDREDELALIDEAVNTLLDKQRLLRTPIIEFYGVEGIGKTALLMEVEERCRIKKLNCFWADIKRNTIDQLIPEAKKLLEEKKPVVIILDSLDAANKEQLQGVEAELQDLTEASKLFVVLASRRIERFESTRSVARKLTSIPLKPLSRESCRRYLDGVGDVIRPETRDEVFNWTRGYPIAMKVMVEAILREGLNPANEEHQKLLISIISEKAIDQNLLSEADPSELPWYHTILTLLSIPRRFNLVIMQDIIETFARQYKLESSLEYITLPNRINKPTSVLSWNISRAGFSIDMPVRNLFMLKLRIENHSRFVEIHKFLAQINEELAMEVTGSDRIRYLQEFFYHRASSGEVVDLPSILTEYVGQIIQKDSFEAFVQFSEEFSQDEELREVLGDNANIVLSLIHKNLAKMYRHLIPDVSRRDRVRHLRDFFTQTALDPNVKDFPSIFEQDMLQIIQEESADVALLICDELLQDKEIKTLLGQDYERVASVIRRSLSLGRIDWHVDTNDY